MDRKREELVESHDALARHTNESAKDMQEQLVCKNRDYPAGEDPAAMKKKKLAEAERRIHEHKLEAQSLADCANINADLAKGDVENIQLPSASPATVPAQFLRWWRFE